jgi:hypothetical protein
MSARDVCRMVCVVVLLLVLLLLLLQVTRSKIAGNAAR